MEKRRLIVMRHATAAGGGPSDHARRLTTRGRDEAYRVGLALRASEVIPDRVLCSTAVRCRETWEAVSAGLAAPSVDVEFEKNLYNATAGELLHELAGVVDARCVLLIAHNPGVSVLALDLAGGEGKELDPLRTGFTPATTADFEFSEDWSALSSSSARLVRFDRND